MTKTETAAMKMFSTEQLEDWKDQIAEWWGKEHLRYDHKQVVELFQKWFGVTKKDAIEMEFNSREDSEKFIEGFLNHLVNDFRAKLHERGRVARIDVSMSFQDGAFATTEFPAGSGQEFQHDVPGHAGIVGQVYYRDGSIQTVFQRFISHPFWQYSHRTGQPPVGDGSVKPVTVANKGAAQTKAIEQVVRDRAEKAYQRELKEKARRGKQRVQ